jgi:hypothetical protein
MSGLHLHPIKGNYMEPTLRGGRDFILVAPIGGYDYDGIYLFDDGSIHRADRGPGRTVALWGDNPAYRRHIVDLDWFNDHVVAKAVGELKMSMWPHEVEQLVRADQRKASTNRRTLDVTLVELLGARPSEASRGEPAP